MGAQEARFVGIAWNRREDYARILEIMADRDDLPITFDRWQSRAERAEAKARTTGKTVYRAYIYPDEFIAWCTSAGRQVNAEARTAWAAFVAYREQHGSH